MSHIEILSRNKHIASNRDRGRHDKYHGADLFIEKCFNDPSSRFPFKRLARLSHHGLKACKANMLWAVHELHAVHWMHVSMILCDDSVCVFVNTGIKAVSDLMVLQGWAKCPAETMKFTDL
jgi:hypothetical protein